MGRYTPSLKLDRRRRLTTPNNNDVVRTAMLGVFMILFAFFVALCANTKPNEQKTVDIIATLQTTFNPVTNDGLNLAAQPDIPDWLKTAGEGEEQTTPLAEMRKLFPDAFAKSHDNWGALELRFTEDTFHEFILNESDIPRRLFAGLSTQLGNQDPENTYVLELALGLKDTPLATAQKTQRNMVRELLQFGIHPSRILAGFDSGSGEIVLRMVPVSRYEGIIL